MLTFETGEFAPKWIINFPTKRHWRGKSRLEDIDSGLAALRNDILSARPQVDRHTAAWQRAGRLGLARRSPSHRARAYRFELVDVLATSRRRTAAMSI